MCRKLVKKIHLFQIHKSRSGFTLTEVLVASILLITAMIPILRGMTAMHSTSSRIEQRIVSLDLAQAKMDEIKARSIYHYSSNFGQNNVSLGNGYMANISDNTVNSNLRKITVRAGFDSDSSNSLSSLEVLVELSTFLARRW